MTHLNGFERVTHHGDEHVDEYDDNGYVVNGKQQHPHPLDDRRCVTTPGKTADVQVVLLLRLVLNLNAVDVHQAKHRPEQAVQRPRETGGSEEKSEHGRAQIYMNMAE